ncbi:MAG TPA: peptide deformylase [Bacteroidota bacterium]|nr:peptide deformylase [Bacteroidota bacterium]
MSVLPIYIYGQSVLRKKARPVRNTSEELSVLARDMIETMRKANGIGLAANQVGDLRRIIVVDAGAIAESEEVPPIAMINPEVLAEEGTWTIEEGCLSIPEIRDEVERAEKIRVRYFDTDFRAQELSADALLARVILHEIDHLNGVLFLDHLGAVKRKLLRGRLNKLERGEVDVDYPIVGNSLPATGTDPR